MVAEIDCVMPWWELLIVWVAVGAALGILGALVFGYSPRVGCAVGIPVVSFVGAALELLRRWKESR